MKGDYLTIRPIDRRVATAGGGPAAATPAVDAGGQNFSLEFSQFPLPNARQVDQKVGD
jgi:hypothetical protein